METLGETRGYVLSLFHRSGFLSSENVFKMKSVAIHSSENETLPESRVPGRGVGTAWPWKV